MFYLQLFVPAGLVLLMFGIGHSFVEVDYSGVYYEETLEEVVEPITDEDIAFTDEDIALGGDLPEEVGADGLPLLPDKYNYLKIENVFQGRLLDTQELFSLEVAVATYQTNVTADFFIKGIAEIESDLVAEITNMIVDTTAEQLTTVEGRTLITEKIKSELNNYLVEEDYNPDIHFVYIINYNII